jgi:phage terminase large subunit-like protein
LIASLPKSPPRKTIENLRKTIPNLSNRRALNQALEEKYEWKPLDAQAAPPGDWRVWLLLAGRGFGKTRTGAEYVRAMVEARRARRIALVAPTALDARAIMVEGESGLLSVGPFRSVNAPNTNRHCIA